MTAYVLSFCMYSAAYSPPPTPFVRYGFLHPLRKAQSYHGHPHLQSFTSPESFLVLCVCVCGDRRMIWRESRSYAHKEACMQSIPWRYSRNSFYSTKSSLFRSTGGADLVEESVKAMLWACSGMCLYHTCRHFHPFFSFVR